MNKEKILDKLIKLTKDDELEWDKYTNQFFTNYEELDVALSKASLMISNECMCNVFIHDDRCLELYDYLSDKNRKTDEQQAERFEEQLKKAFDDE